MPARRRATFGSFRSTSHPQAEALMRRAFRIEWAFVVRKRGRRVWTELGSSSRADAFPTRAAAEAKCRWLEKNAAEWIVARVVESAKPSGKPARRRSA